MTYTETDFQQVRGDENLIVVAVTAACCWSKGVLTHEHLIDHFRFVINNNECHVERGYEFLDHNLSQQRLVGINYHQMSHVVLWCYMLGLSVYDKCDKFYIIMIHDVCCLRKHTEIM